MLALNSKLRSRISQLEVRDIPLEPKVQAPLQVTLCEVLVPLVLHEVRTLSPVLTSKSHQVAMEEQVQREVLFARSRSRAKSETEGAIRSGKGSKQESCEKAQGLARKSRVQEGKRSDGIKLYDEREMK